MAQIALNVIVFAVVMGVLYTVRTATLARQRKTRWRIWIVEGEPEIISDGVQIISHYLLVWDTTLPPEIAIHHLPMVGTKWGDDIIESVGSEDL